MQLYFIRHGQSENNAKWDKATDESPRVHDPALTEIGVLQAQYTAKKLLKHNPDWLADKPEGWIDGQNRAGYDITHIYCSLMDRAAHTASIIADALDLPVYGVSDMHELGGIYQEKLVDGVKKYEILHGHTAESLKAKYPRLQLIHPIEDRGWWRGGHEEVEERLPRAHRIVELLKNRHMGTEDRVAVITHGGIFSYILRVFLGLDMDKPQDRGLPYRFYYDNCGITRLDVLEDRVRLVYLNNASHIPDVLIGDDERRH